VRIIQGACRHRARRVDADRTRQAQTDTALAIEAVFPAYELGCFAHILRDAHVRYLLAKPPRASLATLSSLVLHEPGLFQADLFANILLAVVNLGANSEDKVVDFAAGAVNACFGT
jgi:hypothetical protein